MPRKLVLLVLFVCYSITTWADHLVGGELFYTYVGMAPNNIPRYKVTMRFFRNMHANVPSIDNEPVYIGVYKNNVLYKSITLDFQKVDTITGKWLSPCATGDVQRSVYEVGYFSTEVDLPQIGDAYTLAWQRCCRTNLIDNMNLNNNGITLLATIPGSSLINNQFNNSAIFPLLDTVLICNSKPFTLEFGATDPDHDSLSYAFYTGLDGASLSDPSPEPATTLQLIPLNYKAPFTANQPMGAGVTIDPVTGIISGMAPAAGTYIVTAKVFEWRNHQLINEHNKDIQIKVKACTYPVAQLQPQYAYCKDLTATLKDEYNSNSNSTHFWDFGVNGIDNDTSNLPAVSYTYPASGIYIVKMVINRGEVCADSTTTTVKIFPGLKTGFYTTGSCLQSPVQFTDTSTFADGVINTWRWDFGDPTSISPGSLSQNPNHTYTSSGLKNVQLIIGTDIGCQDTVYSKITVHDSPALTLFNKDTTICRGDTVALHASGTGSFLWQPALNISNVLLPDPFVSPQASAGYKVTLTDVNNCTTTKSVQITILAHDKVQFPTHDLTICNGDSTQLHPETTAKVYQWDPTTGFNPNNLTPVVSPSNETVFTLTANPGICQTSDTIHIHVLETPVVKTGNDVTIQPGVTIQLSATGADTYHWWPTTGLSNPYAPDPVVTLTAPIDSMVYVVTGYYLNGCSSKDTVIVFKFPFIEVPNAFTPNGDGKNDGLRPLIQGRYLLVNFSVFNRWGQLIFQTNEKGKYWDGRINGIDQPAGTYVWMLRLKDYSGKLIESKGTSILIR